MLIGILCFIGGGLTTLILMSIIIVGKESENYERK